MILQNLQLFLWWWGTLVLLGIVILPLTASLFPRFVDKGYIFSKILSIALVSYLSLFFGILHIFRFNQLSLILFLGILTIFSYGFFGQHIKIFFSKKFLLLALFEEFLFVSTFLFWVTIRGFNPEIHGLEKYMDFGFINSILRSEYFPPLDMWFSPFSINYYYFGHLYSAVLTKLSGIPSNITYNLLLGTVAGLCMTASFSLALNLLHGQLYNVKRVFVKIGLGALLAAALVTFGGNLHTIYTLYPAYENEKPVPFWTLGGPLFSTIGQNSDNATPAVTNKYLNIVPSLSTFPNEYWYPNATRYIFNTIHEFPIYSWVVADLHGHVLDIPFVLLTIAMLYSLFTLTSIKDFSAIHAPYAKRMPQFLRKSIQYLSFYDFHLVVFIGFLLAVMYMTNAWDGLIYLLLTGLVLLAVSYSLYAKGNLLQLLQTQPLLYIISRMVIIFAGFIIFSLPFSIHFKPFVSGIGILCAPGFLTTIGSVGPFLFEKDHCQHSLWWQMLTLYGFFLFVILSFLVFLRQRKKSTEDIFVLILSFLALLLILIPEFIYVKDIYPAHYRANTMFKLVFQAFIMLSLVSGYCITKILTHIRYKNVVHVSSLLKVSYLIVIFVLLSLVFMYPYFAITSYYNSLSQYQGIDGTSYLKTLHPDDYTAITWLNNHVKGQPVLLEAQGDSYTDYARISSNTGLPTVLGWTVHEWLWRGTYDIPAPRITDIQTLYESTNITDTKNVLKKYTVEYVYLGDLERQKYPNLQENKWDELGTVIFKQNQTTIYKISQ